MCLILVAWRRAAAFPLVVAANRDELHARPAGRAGYWSDHPDILAGRDLEANGTWMGVSRAGRFAAVTNYRGDRDASAKQSRGALVSGFLSGNSSPRAFMEKTEETGASYSGFNLLVADRDELWWLSNRAGPARRLEPGIHGLGNVSLDTADVAESRARFASAIDPVPAIEPLFSALAAARIVAPDYGTRCSTVLLDGNDGILRFAERSFDPAGAHGSTLRYETRRSG